MPSKMSTLPPASDAEEEQHCKFVSSRGLLKSCNVHPETPVSSIRNFPQADYPPRWIDNLQAGSSVYVCTSALADFVTNVFPVLVRCAPPFVLVTGDSDELVPTDTFPTL